MDTEDTSMRDDLVAALDMADETGETYEETPQEVDTLVEVEDTTDTTGTTDTTDTTDTTAAVTTSKDSIKAPIDWGAKEREDWSKIPRHLQEKVMSREKEISTMLQSTAEARKTHEQFTQLADRYGAVLAGVAGNSPMETANNLFSTVANLRVGSPIQKAQIIANMIKQFDVDVNTLDSTLVGAAPPQEIQQASHIERILAERLAPFEALMGQQRALENQQKQQRAEAAQDEVINFSQQAEFLNDVRLDMADLLDMAAARGVNMTMQEAYDKCCALNPQISTVLAERKKREQLMGGRDTMAAKRAAASSIVGRKIGGGGQLEGSSIRDTIAAAWDANAHG
jgi:hypothetical protein